MNKQSLVIGKLNYLNNYPIYYAIEKGIISVNSKIVEGNPAFLNKRFKENKLDVTPISVVQYLRSINNIDILNNLSISSNKEVGSIFLFSKYPISKLSEKKIAITTSSETSVILLKILLKNIWNVNSKFISYEPNFEKMLNENDAALLIGDDALRVIWENSFDIKQFYVKDLGKVWYDWTGLPMVYAVWAYKKHLSKDKEFLLNTIRQNLIKSKNYGLENLSEIINLVHKETNFSKENLQSYYNCLSFDLDKNKITGLLLFVKLANEMNLLNVNYEEIKSELNKNL